MNLNVIPYFNQGVIYYHEIEIFQIRISFLQIQNHTRQSSLMVGRKFIGDPEDKLKIVIKTRFNYKVAEQISFKILKKIGLR